MGFQSIPSFVARILWTKQRYRTLSLQLWLFHPWLYLLRWTSSLVTLPWWATLEVATDLETAYERTQSSPAGMQPQCLSCNHFVSTLHVHTLCYQQEPLTMTSVGPNNYHCEWRRCCRCHSHKHLEGEMACCKSLVQSPVKKAYGLQYLCSSTDEYGCKGIACYVGTTRDSNLITKRKNA